MRRSKCSAINVLTHPLCPPLDRGGLPRDILKSSLIREPACRSGRDLGGCQDDVMYKLFTIPKFAC